MQFNTDPNIREAIRVILEESLSRGDEVAVPSLGVFKLQHRSARLERTPDGKISLTPPRSEIVLEAEE